MKNFLFLAVISFSINVVGIDLKLIEIKRFDQKDALIQICYSFAVTEDETFLLVDSKACNIKIYGKNGTLIKTWGRKGMGPNEFGYPFVCDYQKPRFALQDFQKKKIFIYRRVEKEEYILENEFYCLSFAYDFVLKGNTLLISGFKSKSQKETYDLYLEDFDKKATTFLVPSPVKYGFDSRREYDAKYLPLIAPIGIWGYCALNGDNAYHAWEGNIRIIKINTRTKELEYVESISQDFIKPNATKALRDAYKQHSKEQFVLKNKMSMVCDLFSGKDFIGLIFGNEDQNAKWYFVVQFFTLDGKFLSEKKLTGLNPVSGKHVFYFKGDENLLFYLSHRLDNKLEDIYEIIKYKIITTDIQKNVENLKKDKEPRVSWYRSK